MRRHDDALQQTVRERLHAVAGPHAPTATAGATTGASTGATPGWTAGMGADADGGGQSWVRDGGGPSLPPTTRGPGTLAVPGVATASVADRAPQRRARHRGIAEPGPAGFKDGVSAGTAWLPVVPPPVQEPSAGPAPRRTGPAVGPGEPGLPSDHGGGTRPGRDDAPPSRWHALPAAGTAEPSDADMPAQSDVDTRDVVARIRREALGSAATAYTEAHGHPLDHPRDTVPARRRWFLSVRHAVVAAIAVAVLATGVVVRALTAVPGAPQEMGEGAPSAQVAAPVPGAGGAAGAAVPAGAGASTGAAGSPTPAGGTEGVGADAPNGSPAATAGVVVHVVGQVQAPGVIALPPGSRVGDALTAAGGALAGADLSAVNLARVVADGEQIVVPAPGQAPSVPVTGESLPPGGGTGDGTAPVDLNAADLGALDGLPGIGPVLAQRILDWRTDNGHFRDVEELGEVSGIGDAVLARLRPLVRV